MRLLISLAVLLLSGSAMACEFDTDCQPGSTCEKSPTSIYGVCGGGIQPGNAYDRRPVRDPLDVNGTVGNTCSFDVDCGPGSVCAKAGGIYGVCRR